MRTARRTFVATGTIAILAAAGVTAAIAADPAPPPPPRIAFLANGIVPADALAAGPIAGQLGAPIYTTRQESLSDAAATGLDDYDPELVIVLGGPVAITDAVIDQVETATGLTETDTATPAGGIVRAAGGDRFDTAAAVADLLSAYNPAYLPIDMQAIDADTLDGKQASEFALKSDLGAGGGDADTLDGKDSTDFQPAGNYLAADGKAQTAGHADTAGDADTLDGAHASDFQAAGNYLGANESAQNAYRLGGYGANDYLRTDGSRAMDSTLTYATPQKRTIFVGSREFIANNETAQYGGGGVRVSSTSAWVSTSVSLPDGAVVTGFRAFGTDSDAGTNIEVDLYQDRLGSNLRWTMATVASSGTPGDFDLVDTSISSATVDVDAAEFVISATPTGGNWSGYMGFEGALITYTVTEEH